MIRKTASRTRAGTARLRHSLPALALLAISCIARAQPAGGIEAGLEDGSFSGTRPARYADRQTTVVTISGHMLYYDGVRRVQDVTLGLTGDDTQSTPSGTDGFYSFTVGAGGDYTVTPSKDDDTPPARGVSGIDLLLIRQHILTTNPFDSPYKIIAADVNHSNSVTPVDLLFIRQLILTVIDTFPGRLWRFVPADYVFPDPANPFTPPFPEQRAYTDLSTDATNQVYFSIKHGDVTMDWMPPPGAQAKTDQQAGTVRLSIGSPEALDGGAVRVPVRAYDFRDVASYQFTLEWDPQRLAFDGLEDFALPAMAPQHFGLHRARDGLITTLWDDPHAQGRSLADGAALFALRFRRLQPGPPDVQITDRATAMQAYRGSDLAPLALEVDRATAGEQAAEVPGRVSLEQNGPNPFNPSTEIEFVLVVPGRVRLRVYDVLGREVARLVDGERGAGRHRVRFEAGDLPSGVYVYRLTAGRFTEARMMLLLK